MKRYSCTVVLCAVFSVLQGQEVLTIQQAINLGVEKNYDLRIAKNNTEISTVENGFLNSGFLPRVSVSGGVNYADETQNVTFSDGSDVSVDNAITESYNASFKTEYTIFDGLERRFNVKKNAENLNVKKLQERQQVENTIVAIYETYYNVAYQKQIIANLALTIENSKDRLERNKRQLKYGQGTKLGELNAQIDLNNDSIAFASANKDFKNAKRSLNLLLGREVTTSFEIDTTVTFGAMPSENDLIQSAETNNVASLLHIKNVLLSELDIKINKAKYLPKINGSASYNWNESINPVTSFALNNEAYGINLGVNLSWNLFDGGSNKTRIKTAKIAKFNRQIELYKAKEELRMDIYNAYEDYTNKQFVLHAEQRNIYTNKLNFGRTQKQLELGQISAVEFRQAQINLFNALNNCAKAKYDLKIAELNLLQLAGMLVN